MNNSTMLDDYFSLNTDHICVYNYKKSLESEILQILKHFLKHENGKIFINHIKDGKVTRDCIVKAYGDTLDLDWKAIDLYFEDQNGIASHNIDFIRANTVIQMRYCKSS